MIANSRYSGEQPQRPHLLKEYATALEWAEASLNLEPDTSRLLPPANIAAVAESNSENNQPTQIVADIAVAESDTAKQVDKRAAEQVLCPQCHRFPLINLSSAIFSVAN